jgi:hypothetical protein
MDAEPPLDYLLDESGSGAAGAGAGREELLAIMARSRSQRHRLAAFGMAATLAVGAAGGWLVAGGSQHSSSVGRSLAAGPTTTVRVPAAASASSASGALATPAVGYNITKIFVRTTADGITIRGYKSADPPPQPAGCPASFFPRFNAEVSTADIVATSSAGWFNAESKPLLGFTILTLGVAEGAPVWVVTAQVDSTVSQVRATFADGKTDQMAPVGGWAALAHLAPAGTSYGAPTGSVQVLDKAGKVLDSQPFATPPTIKPLPPVPAQGGGVASSSGGGVVAGNGVNSAVAVTTTAPPKTVVPGSPPQTAVSPPCLIVPPVPAPLTTTAPTTKSAG